jgi:RNA polymerase sigma-70 factor, ECF subfamily
VKSPPAMSAASPSIDALGLPRAAPLSVNPLSASPLSASPLSASPLSAGPLRVNALPENPVPENDGDEPSSVGWRLEPKVPEPPRRSGTALAAPDPADATDAVSAEQAYQLWKGRVWRFASRLGIPNEALEDATQDVFTAVFRRWSDFQGLSTRRTWVLGFVPRVASSYRRRERNRPEPGFDPAARSGAAEHQPSGSSESDPFESTARREATRVVQAFLDGLSEQDRQLFVLVDLEDASVVEAAAILNIATHRAYKILEKIRRSLEATLLRHRAVDRRRLP